MIYELRVYRCVPNRMPALLKRFETATLRIWEKHGIRQAGFWTTMIGECSVPLSLVVPLPVALSILGCAATFHVASAAEMGLNGFMWAFGSTYPAIIYCWYWLHGAHA